jgi:hypothetical protein
VSLAIKDTGTVPPENWSYYVEQTNFTVSTKNYSLLYQLVVEHCQANNAPVPSQQDVTDWQCANLHVSCYESETHVPLINKMGLPFVAKKTSCCQPMPFSPIVEETI